LILQIFLLHGELPSQEDNYRFIPPRRDKKSVIIHPNRVIRVPFVYFRSAGSNFLCVCPGLWFALDKITRIHFSSGFHGSEYIWSSKMINTEN